MDLVFSFFADAGAWPEHPGAGAAVIDQEVVGPLRLLDHVETMLGLGRAAVAAVTRIAVYQRKLEDAGDGRFWSASFRRDPWSSTRELLRWRDGLIEAGWRPGVGAARSRLSDLAAAEEAGPDLPFGLADRLREAIGALEEKPRLSLRSIRLVDDRALLPVGLRTLLDRLEACGVAIERIEEPSAPAPHDERLTLLTADTELGAADALTAWLDADRAANDGLVFVLGKDTALLDHSLAKAGLPRLGRSAPSPHRALLQVLNLSFAMAWEPPDPNRLLDFLLLPICPLPRFAANALADAVAQSPGVGGENWIAAWTKIEQTLSEQEDADPKADTKRLAEWRAFIEPTRHDPLRGMPRAAAKDIAGRVAAWAVMRAAATDDPLFRALAGIASELAVAIDATQADRLDRLLIERMVEQAVDVGVSDETMIAEAAPWRAVAHPGAVWGEAKTIVWWHFADVGETGASSVWNEAERAALREAGCPLDEPGLAPARLAAAWERPLRHARDRLLLVRPALVNGEATKAHPLWHSLAAKSKGLADRVSVRAESVLHDAAPSFAGRTLARMPVTQATPPAPLREWTAPAALIRPREFESASSLEALLSCPLQWTLKYASRLRPGVRQSLPNIDNLIGTVAHRIAQEIFQPGAPPDAANVEAVATSRLEELLPRVAATLLLPGAAGELAGARRAIPQALAELARFLHSEKLTIVGTEHEFSVADTLATGTGATGQIDLLARTPKGRPVVVDLKWQRSEKRRRNELKAGAAIQIAVYARHVADGDDEPLTGFFMLRQRRFLTSAPLNGGMATVIDGASPGETWDRIATSFGLAFEDIGKGVVRATFDLSKEELIGFSDPYLLAPPKCAYCDYAGICGESQ